MEQFESGGRGKGQEAKTISTNRGNLAGEEAKIFALRRDQQKCDQQHKRTTDIHISHLRKKRVWTCTGQGKKAARATVGPAWDQQLVAKMKVKRNRQRRPPKFQTECEKKQNAGPRKGLTKA